VEPIGWELNDVDMPGASGAHDIASEREGSVRPLRQRLSHDRREERGSVHELNLPETAGFVSHEGDISVRHLMRGGINTVGYAERRLSVSERSGVLLHDCMVVRSEGVGTRIRVPFAVR
jgi:hypothetical protein